MGDGVEQNQGQRVTLTLSHLIFSFKGCVFPTDFHVEYKTALCFRTNKRDGQWGGERRSITRSTSWARRHWPSGLHEPTTSRDPCVQACMCVGVSRRGKYFGTWIYSCSHVYSLYKADTKESFCNLTDEKIMLGKYLKSPEVMEIQLYGWMNIYIHLSSSCLQTFLAVKGFWLCLSLGLFHLCWCSRPLS